MSFDFARDFVLLYYRASSSFVSLGVVSFMERRIDLLEKEFSALFSYMFMVPFRFTCQYFAEKNNIDMDN